MKITDSTKLLNNPPKSYTTYSYGQNNIKKLLKTFNSISYKLYLDNNDISLIEKLLTKIEQSNLELLAKDVIDSKSTDLTNYSIEKSKILPIEILILFLSLLPPDLLNLQLIV